MGWARLLELRVGGVVSDLEAGIGTLQSVLPSSASYLDESQNQDQSQDQSRGDSTRRLADRLGICLSALCLVHCLLTPVLILLLPSLQLVDAHGAEGGHAHETFHLALLLVLPILAVMAFIPGYRRHGDKRVFAWAAPGLILVALVAIFFEDISWTGSLISVAGSLMLIRAHVINRRLCACCETGHGKRSRPGRFKSHIRAYRAADETNRKLLTAPRR